MSSKKTLCICGLFGSLLIAILSCESDDAGAPAPTPTTSIEAGRKLQIDNLLDTGIKPLQLQHIVLVESLNQAAEAFKATPSEVTLEALKLDWSRAFLLWKEMEIHNMGVIRSSFIHSSIHEWPANTDFIETTIAGSDALTTAFIATAGASSKGYGSVEYLLYNGNAAEVLAAFTTAANSDRRMAYLTSATENLLAATIALQDLWNVSEDTFRTRLESGVNGSHNIAVNAVIAALETLKIQKLERAINTTEVTETELEAFKSKNSKEAIIANLNALKMTYQGNFQTDGFGMEEYLVEVLNNSELNSQILEKFNQAISLFEQTTPPLEELAQNRDTLLVLRDAITEIIVLIKNDYASAANIVVTFNDNDGDS